MIVCLCHHISDRDIVRAAREGVGTFEDLQNDLLVASACECCLECALEIFDEARSQRPVRPMTPLPSAFMPSTR